MTYQQGVDPYHKCLKACRHDLGRGVMVGDLLDHDGPEESSVIEIIRIPARGRNIGATIDDNEQQTN